jgi:hypothetical protein
MQFETSYLDESWSDPRSGKNLGSATVPVLVEDFLFLFMHVGGKYIKLLPIGTCEQRPVKKASRSEG